MGKTASLLICILTLVMAVSTVSLANATGEAKPSVTIARTVQIHSGGPVVINETVTIRNNSTAPISNFLIGLPMNYSSNLVISRWQNGSIILPVALGPNNEKLNIQLNAPVEKENIYGINVGFTRPIDLNQNYTFTLTYIFSKVISYSFEESRYEISLPSYSCITQNANKCNVTVIFPVGSSVKDFETKLVNGKPAFSYYAAPLKAYSNDFLHILFTSLEMRLLECDWATRNVTLDPWGWVHISDSYHIKNLSPLRVDRITLALPRGFRDVAANDVGGAISATTSESEGGLVTASISLRLPLQVNQFYTFTVHSSAPARVCIKQLDWGMYRLEFQLSPAATWVINKLSVSVNLPEGAEFELPMSLPTTITHSGLRQTSTYELIDATPIVQDMSFKVNYRYNVFWAAFRPVIWLGTVIAGICGIIVISRRTRPRVPILAIPTEVLRSFVDAYDERISLQAELESLENRLKAGKIRRHDYKWRSKDIRQRTTVLDRELVDLKAKLKKAGGNYAGAVSKIEAAEGELETIKRDLDQIELQYRLGKISKEAYTTLIDGFEKRRGRARATIDETIISLRGELR